ncbi:MAG TPA: serine hydrolase domain-containing protein [Gaiellaceae bacterium]|nr:serine hydrolase domain-containing protein [Gaiellaceae bacterium]
MGSAIPQQKLAEIVRDARARSGVPAVAAGLLVGERVELAADGPVEVETPFRIASITKWFTASLAALLLDLDAPLETGASAGRLLSHTADLRPSSRELLPEPCRGLWSYSNAGFVFAGRECAAVAGTSFSDAVRDRLLEPLGLERTSFEEPPDATPGHVQEGATGHRPAPEVVYPEPRRAAGGLWSTVGDLLRFAAHQLGGPGPLSAAQLATVHEPRAEALGARYCLGCWSRALAGARSAFDHEGSVGGYQSLLLIVPEEETALAVLTNSWRGSGLIRRVVRDLGLVPSPVETSGAEHAEQGRYALDDAVAVVAEHYGRWRVAESETDPLTGLRIDRPEYAVDPLGGGVFGFAGGLLMSHRVDFPRRGIARVGWTALPISSP